MKKRLFWSSCGVGFTSAALILSGAASPADAAPRGSLPWCEALAEKGQIDLSTPEGDEYRRLCLEHYSSEQIERENARIFRKTHNSTYTALLFDWTAHQSNLRDNARLERMARDQGRN